MNRAPSSRSGLLTAPLVALLFGAAAAFVSSPAAADNKCTIAIKGDNSVVKACQEGGVKAAKKEMKRMVTVAEGKGKKFDCDGCHKNTEDYKLSADGAKRFKDLLSAQ